MSIKKLKIYFTSDTHGYFYPTTYGDMLPKNVGLFSCVSNWKKDENTLIIDGGDVLQGNAFSYYTNHVLKGSKVLADIMNDCGYDYYTLGNHDFNYGLDYQSIYIRNHNGRCVCQNILDEEGKHLYPYDIKVMPNGLRVGIVGIVTDYINIWEKKENLVGIQVVDPFAEAKKALMELSGKTDINICIYHGGFECDLETGERLTTSTENIGYKICEELGFDVLLTGHQHMSVDGRYIVSKSTGHRTYIVQPLDAAKEYHYIEIEVQIDTDKCNNKQVVDHNNIMVTSRKIKADCNTAKSAMPIIEELPINGADEKNQRADEKNQTGETLYDKYLPYENKVQKWLNEPIGTLSRALVPSDKLDMAYNGTPIADFINRVQLYFSGAQVSAVGLANEIAGFREKVSTRDVIATYPYPNTLVVLKITGKNLKLAIERSAEYFAYDAEGKLTVSESFLSPKVEHYNYDYFAGVAYDIDPSKPVGNRIVRLEYNGKPVAPEQEFTLCLNNYRASGAGEYPMYKECAIVKEINIEMVELLMEYFRMNPVVEV